MASNRVNTFGTRQTIQTENGPLVVYQLQELEKQGYAVSDLPISIKILLEAALRNENGKEVTREDVIRIASYNPSDPGNHEIPFMPARVLLQDFTGVPAVVDLAAMRSALHRLGGDPQKINPVINVDLVIDHSIQVDKFGTFSSLASNSDLEFQRNRERYQFLRWGQKVFDNFRVVPPSSGIVHQVNLEYLATGILARREGNEVVAYPDSLVGTDSHTTMINGLGILGWGVGGIEAEAAMLGQALYMLPPEVVGVELVGEMPEGATATDLVLLVTQVLRKKGVVNKIVEFCGKGLSSLSLPDRATIANMAPEYGATASFFPVDEEALEFLRRTGRNHALISSVEAVSKALGLFRTDDSPTPRFTEKLTLDLATVLPSISGPKRPQDRIELGKVKSQWAALLTQSVDKNGFGIPEEKLSAKGTVVLDPIELPNAKVPGTIDIGHGDVVIAAITSCTNTSNPSVMLAAGLLAKKAVQAGLVTKPYVKTSLAPGSKVVTDYLVEAGLLPYLERLGFHVVGYGCTTCIGNSGPLPKAVADAIESGDLVAASVLSGNRNFEGRINPHVRANFLASPPLVVAYALAGTMNLDLTTQPIGVGKEGKPVFLKDIWPTGAEIRELLNKAIRPDLFQRAYTGIEQNNIEWNAIPVADSPLYAWDPDSTYIQEPPYFEGMDLSTKPIAPIAGARVLAYLGDSVTTDHISPAGDIAPNGPAGRFLVAHGVQQSDFNSYGSRRGNDRVMTRGTFANIRLKNRLVPGVEGGVTVNHLTGETCAIYDAAQDYRVKGLPTVVLAGKDYGMGSSRDWAAKGTLLLGVKAVIAESYERIHRSNLVGMGVLPLQFLEGQNAASLGLTGLETFDVPVTDQVKPGQELEIQVTAPGGTPRSITVRCRLDSPVEVDYYRNGGILPMMVRRLVKE